ncbi:Lrp/AsnC ligand binding domain-containing protein [Streptomyces sp. TRM S81-3]|uniref:Lrp/AsnC ligand binding domain-containing protein n=1 Tax=Streptomyces griseicoloratus TaxID=2752516 RepID=A0A926QPF0_9ACTN|nr:Lrp/AsnC ligand binding domain-containing protein [Streptomyces griseicoloratus]MBD0418450.1 Lrp/AsnC ligand binding domain-containing protein [Streptomyces griseicoloratus]
MTELHSATGLAPAGTGRAVAALPEVRFAAAVTGRTHPAVSVLCGTTDDLYTFLSERLGALTAVRTAESVLTLRWVKTLTRQSR